VEIVALEWPASNPAANRCENAFAPFEVAMEQFFCVHFFRLRKNPKEI
jgi:hypothetical protein